MIIESCATGFDKKEEMKKASNDKAFFCFFTGVLLGIF